MKMTQWQIANLLFTAGQAEITLPGGKVGIVQSVTRESGSGKSFILAVLVGGKTVNQYVRVS